MKRTIIFILAALAMMQCKAQSVLMPEQESNVMNEKRAVVEEQARFASTEQYADLCIKYHVKKWFGPRLKQILAERETKKVCYNYIYENMPFKRARAKREIDSLYQDSIDIRLIPYNKNISGEYVSFALAPWFIRHLDSTQIQAFSACALNLAHKLRKDPKYDTWPEERKAITSILKPRDVERFFVKKNGRKISQDFHTTWDRLKKAGLTAQLDSVSDGALCVMYYEKTYAINDLYQSDKAARRKALATLNGRKPLMIRLLDGLNKKEALEKKNKQQQKIGKDFVW